MLTKTLKQKLVFVLLLIQLITTYGETIDPDQQNDNIIDQTDQQEQIEETNIQPIQQRLPTGNVVSDNLIKVYQIGSEIGHPETLQAILLVESNGGVGSLIGNKSGPESSRSYGVMQVKTVAARSVFTHYPMIFQKYFHDRKYKSVTTDEIINLLLTNHEANIRIAGYHFKIYFKLSQNNWHKAVAAYNMGIGNANKLTNHRNVNYVKKIEYKINSQVLNFNTKHQLRK